MRQKCLCSNIFFHFGRLECLPSFRSLLHTLSRIWSLANFVASFSLLSQPQRLPLLHFTSTFAFSQLASKAFSCHRLLRSSPKYALYERFICSVRRHFLGQQSTYLHIFGPFHTLTHALPFCSAWARLCVCARVRVFRQFPLFYCMY